MNSKNLTNPLRLQINYLYQYRGDSKRWDFRGVTQESHILYAILDGEGEIESNGKIYKLEPGDLCLLSPGIKMNLSTPHHIQKLWGAFNLFIPPGFDVLSEYSQILHLKSIFDPKDIFELNPSAKEARFKSFIWRLISDLECDLLEAPENKYSQKLDKLISHINQHLDAQLRVQDLADFMGLRHESLSRLFKNEYGVTLKNYLSQRLNQEICLMIRQDGMNNSDLTEKFNFAGESYFYQFFKRMNHCSPSHYRKRFS